MIIQIEVVQLIRHDQFPFHIEGELPENDGNKEKRDAATATDDCDVSLTKQSLLFLIEDRGVMV